MPSSAPDLRVSLLGLAWPFAAVDPGGERMRATVAAPREELGCPAGSLRRYAGDTYAGGNRWVLAALWLGLLREQVTDDGEPAWVMPLAWSHAMLLLAVRPELSWR